MSKGRLRGPVVKLTSRSLNSTGGRGTTEVISSQTRHSSHDIDYVLFSDGSLTISKRNAPSQYIVIDYYQLREILEDIKERKSDISL